MSAADARANGLSFVCRYVSQPGQAKNLRRSEVVDFQNNGIGIVVVFENGTSSALNGASQGVADAQSADAQVRALGLAGCPIYFAVDFDAQPYQFGVVGGYLAGAASVLGHNRTGVYGGYYVVKYALDGNLVKYAWQAIAWSDGLIDSRAHIFQGSGGNVAGVDVDHDRTISSDVDYGQAGYVPAPPAPKPFDVLSFVLGE